MSGENGFFIPPPNEFQKDIDFNDARSPFMVVQQTNLLLGLYYNGLVFNERPAREYLGEYSMDYIDHAIEGADTLYDRVGNIRNITLEASEAAHHAFVIFSFMRDTVTSPFFPVGFSSQGMLKGPSTKGEFTKRVRELKGGIANITSGVTEHRRTLEAYPPIFRVFKFFEVGSGIEFRHPGAQRRQTPIQSKEFNTLLGDLHIELD